MNVFKKFLFAKDKDKAFAAFYISKMKKPLPRFMMNRIRTKHMKKNATGYLHRLDIDTYEGSGQATHPDILFWKGLYRLSFTPYPFSIGCCENPSVLSGKTIETVFSSGRKANPLNKPVNVKKGDFFSDPVLYEKDEKLYIVYRESIVEKQKNNRQRLLSQYTCDGLTWSKPEELCASEQYSYISPAIITDNNSSYCFFIQISDLYSFGGKLMLMRLTSEGISQPYEMKINGHYFGEIWHMSIVCSDNQRTIAPSDSNDTIFSAKLKGLFLCRSSLHNENNTLYTGVKPENSDQWFIENEVQISPEALSHIKIIYKSVFIPGSDDIIASVCDNDGYWALIILKKNIEGYYE